MRYPILSAVALLALMSSSSASLAGKKSPAPEPQSDTRPQWLWLEAEGGGAHVGLNTFTVDEGATTAGFRRQSTGGPMIGVGGGVQLFVMTLGPRLRLGFFDRFTLTTLGGELGIRVPIGVAVPHFDLGGGYASVGNMRSDEQASRPEISIDGLYGRLGGGLDLHVSRGVTVGANVSGELYAMSPPGVNTSTPREIQQSVSRGDAVEAANRIKQAEGTSYGSGLTISASVGFHY